MYTKTVWTRRQGDDKILRTVILGVMEGQNKIGRPHREWVDDTECWGKDTAEIVPFGTIWWMETENLADTGGLGAQPMSGVAPQSSGNVHGHQTARSGVQTTVRAEILRREFLHQAHPRSGEGVSPVQGEAN